MEGTVVSTLREQKIESAVKKGYEYFEKTFNWAQSTLAGLLREFLPENPCDEELIKACSAMPGLGTRGKTCGTVSGASCFWVYSMGGTVQQSHRYHTKTGNLSKKWLQPEYGDRYMERKVRYADTYTQILWKTIWVQNSTNSWNSIIPVLIQSVRK